MPDVIDTAKAEGSASHSAHLSVRPEDAGPGELLFTFEQQEKRIPGAVGVSVLSHLAAIALIFLIGRLIPERVYEAVLPDRLPDIVWLAEPGPGGGGGGSPEPPPKKTVLPKAEKPKIPTPVEPPKQTPVEPQPPVESPIPAQTVEVAPAPAIGVPESTQASNTGGGGSGTGAGSGQGAGLGPGTDRGVGGGAYRPGNGVMIPKVLREVKPAYTAEAMRAKVQGTVLLECIVLQDGSVGRVEVVKSLDGTFGLDQEAIKAAKQWRFAPGTRFGEPVAVLVTIELTFTLR